MACTEQQIIRTSNFEKQRRENSRFGGGVDGVERIGGHNRGSTGADVDDGATLPVHHAREHGVGDPRDALDVDPDQAPHEALVHLVEVAGVRVGDPGVVDEHADVEAPDALLERVHPGGEPLAREVEDECADLGLGVLRPDLLGDRGELVRVAADEHEVEAGGGEAEGDGAADAVGGAGDDGPGPVAAAQGLAGAEEGGVDPEREAQGGAGGDEEADGGQGERPRRLRAEELNVGARAGHGARWVWGERSCRCGAVRSGESYSGAGRGGSALGWILMGLVEPVHRSNAQP